MHGAAPARPSKCTTPPMRQYSASCLIMRQLASRMHAAGGLLQARHASHAAASSSTAPSAGPTERRLLLTLERSVSGDGAADQALLATGEWCVRWGDGLRARPRMALTPTTSVHPQHLAAHMATCQCNAQQQQPSLSCCAPSPPTPNMQACLVPRCFPTCPMPPPPLKCPIM